MEDHEKIHYEALLGQKNSKIQRLKDENARIAADLVELRRTPVEDAPKQSISDNVLDLHIELLEAALIGAGQESGIHAIRNIVAGHIVREDP